MPRNRAAWPSGGGEGTGLRRGRFNFEADLGWVSRAGGGGGGGGAPSGLTLAWTRLRADSKIKEEAYLPASQLRSLYDEWQALVVDFDEGAPASLGRAMQIASKRTVPSDNKWLHMILQEAYVSMALTGIAWGLGIATLVLLLATLNLVVTAFAIFAIGGSLCCVAGSIVLRGWQLGQAESLSMMILTGFAVDYVVHLAHAYMESTAARPLERVHDALRALGISVFWGMLTSVIAAGVLSTLQLQFFAKFGTFFLLTIAWSYAWAVLFLMPSLALMGPRGIAAPRSAGKEVEIAAPPPFEPFESVPAAQLAGGAREQPASYSSCKGWRSTANVI